MKISKEGHKRMSVTLKKENMQKNDADKTKGQILPLPEGEGLEKYIQKRVANTQKLYKVLGPSAVSVPNEKEKETIDCFNDFIKNIILKNVNTQPAEKRNRNAVEYMKTKGNVNTVFIDVDRKCIHKLVPLHLRGTLKKYVKIEKDGQRIEVYIPDVIEKLVFAVAHGTQFDHLIAEIEEEELIVCLHMIFKDYTKEDIIANTAKSIEKQDVKVQVLGTGEDARLQLASADNEKKKYIFLFLKKFACAVSEKERNDLLREFRELLVLFYCGTAAYEEVKEWKNGIPIWDFDFLSKMVSDISWFFSQECSEKLMEREQLRREKDKDKKRQNKSKIKDIDVEVKGILANLITERYRESIKLLQSLLGEEEY